MNMQQHKKQNRQFRRCGAALALVSTLCLVGCATKPNNLYDWQGYQNNVNDYLRGDKSSMDKQIASMEEDLKKIRAGAGVVPPGYNAHLGLLYAKQGNLNEFANRLDAETSQYPEAQSFMEFLLRNFKTKK